MSVSENWGPSFMLYSSITSLIISFYTSRKEDILRDKKLSISHCKIFLICRKFKSSSKFVFFQYFVMKNFNHIGKLKDY